PRHCSRQSPADDLSRRPRPQAVLSISGDGRGALRLLCHAYCLMTNHYHLLLETPEPNLGRGMLVVNGSYARYLNRTHELDGHVFDGPYGVDAVERDEHLLETCRYIVRNPVRAGLVDNPGDWSWSSYRATGGLEQAPPFLHVRFVRALFGSTSSYRDFCNRVAEQPGCASES